MSRLPKALVSVLALLLVALLGAGWWAQNAAQATRTELVGQAQIAGELLALQQAEGTAEHAALTDAVAGALDSLAPAAVLQADTPAPLPVGQQLDNSLEGLMTVGMDTENVQERAQALTAIANIWQAARADGLAKDTLPAPLATRLSELAAQGCDAPADSATADDSAESSDNGKADQQAPTSVTALQETYFALAYTSEFYSARTANGYADLSERTENLARSSQAYINRLAPAATCYGYTAAEEAAYPVVPADHAAAQLDELEDAAHTNARAVLADTALPHEADAIEALALAAALTTG